MSYRGADRRGAARYVPPTPFGHVFLIAAALASLAAALLFALGTGDGDVQEAPVTLLVEGAAAAVLAVSAGLCGLRWRLGGSAPALWAATGAALVGPVAVVARHVVPVLADRDLGEALAVAAVVVGAGVLARGAVTPPVDTSLRPARLAAGVLAAGAVLALALWRAGVDLPADERGPDAAVAVVLALTWAAVAATCVVRSRRAEAQRTVVWLAITAGVLAVRALAMALPGGGAVRETDAALLLLAALPIVWGAGCDLHHAFVAQDHELLRSARERSEVEARAAAARHQLEHHAHQARNALMAIAGATTTLERYQAQLPPATREQLAAAVASEVARLQRLVDGEVELASRLAPSGPGFAGVGRSPGGDDLEQLLDAPEVEDPGLGRGVAGIEAHDDIGAGSRG